VTNSGRDLFAIHSEFADVDHFSEVVRAWDLEFFQTDRGAFQANLEQIGTAQASLAGAHFSRALEQNGSSPPGMRTFALPAKRNMRFCWRGQEVRDHHMMLFPPDGELFSLSPAGFSIFTFSIHEPVLHTTAETMGFPEVVDVLASGVELLGVGRAAMDRLLRRCRSTLDLSKGTGKLSSADKLRAQLCEGIAPLIVRALATATKIPRNRPITPRRSRAIAKARELVREFHREPLTVKRICEEAGVSARTLEYAFQETFGMAPKPWLMKRSLNLVHSHLRRARGTGTTVADIANDWGFWHMGQFAADYKKMFGKLPSQTLVGG